MAVATATAEEANMYVHSSTDSCNSVQPRRRNPESELAQATMHTMGNDEGELERKKRERERKIEREREKDGERKRERERQ